jgi:hypothetical protein
MATSGQTTRAKVPYSLATDAAILNSDIYNISNWIDGNVPLWTTAAYSGTTPTGTNGEFWWCPTQNTAYYGLNYYNGTSWVNIGVQEVTFSSTAPSSPYNGQVWINSSYSNPSVSVYNGSGWVSVINGTSVNGQYLISTASGPNWTALPNTVLGTTNSWSTGSPVNKSGGIYVGTSSFWMIAYTGSYGSISSPGGATAVTGYNNYLVNWNFAVTTAPSVNAAFNIGISTTFSGSNIGSTTYAALGGYVASGEHPNISGSAIVNLGGTSSSAPLYLGMEMTGSTANLNVNYVSFTVVGIS